MIEFNKAKQILQTLPVSYYLKRKLNVKLDYTDTSYIDIFNDNLVVSYNQLNNLENATESDIRCLLYHEVSHAFLTPLHLGMTNIINIFEDERIETICKNYYIDVDFKTFVKKVNNFHDEQPTSSMELFYQIVRYRKGEKQFTDRVNNLIITYANLNRNSSYDKCQQYYNDIITLYYDIRDFFDRNNQQNTSNKSNNSDNSDNSDDTDESSNSNNMNESNDTNKSNDNNKQNTSNQLSNVPTNVDTSNQTSDDTLDDDICKNAIKSGLENITTQVNNLVDSSLQETFKQLFISKTKADKMNSSAINSYSGVFDARSCGRQDYKYFVQKNRFGNVKRFSKVKLNLFIDTSGSFYISQDVVNKMLYNLKLIEKQMPDFEFDVISMGYGEKLLSKNNRKIHCNGGNYLDSEIINIFKKVQNNDATNVNIILFDGNAFSYASPLEIINMSKNFAAFNHQNCTIISDYDNKNYINKYCKAAKTIFVNYNYAKYLIKNVVDSLKHLLK